MTRAARCSTAHRARLALPAGTSPDGAAQGFLYPHTHKQTCTHTHGTPGTHTHTLCCTYAHTRTPDGAAQVFLFHFHKLGRPAGGTRRRLAGCSRLAGGNRLRRLRHPQFLHAPLVLFDALEPAPGGCRAGQRAALARLGKAAAKARSGGKRRQSCMLPGAISADLLMCATCCTGLPGYDSPLQLVLSESPHRDGLQPAYCGCPLCR